MQSNPSSKVFSGSYGGACFNVEISEACLTTLQTPAFSCDLLAASWCTSNKWMSSWQACTYIHRSAEEPPWAGHSMRRPAPPAVLPCRCDGPACMLCVGVNLKLLK